MEITKLTWELARPELLENIHSATYIALDLELSGISTTADRARKSGKSTLEERYAETKRAAEKYQVLQVGLCPVVWDGLAGKYMCCPYNIYISPIAAEGRGVTRDREVTFNTSAAHFLVEQSNLDFNAVFKKGVPYLTKAEELELTSQHYAALNAVYEDMDIEPQYEPFINETLSQIETWLSTPKREPFLNICPPNSILSGYEKRIVHQVVRTKYPKLKTIGKSTFVQVIDFNQQREDAVNLDRTVRFKSDLKRAIGFREIVDVLFGGFDRDKKGGRKHVLVGHNLLIDIINLYKCFVGPLPETVGEFSKILESSFECIIDTKYIATASKTPGGGPGTSGADSSSLQQLWKLHEALPHPAIDAPPAFSTYLKPNFERNHEAGFDAFNTARVLLRLVGMQLKPEEEVGTEKVETRKKKGRRGEVVREEMVRPSSPVPTTEAAEGGGVRLSLGRSAMVNRFAALELDNDESAEDGIDFEDTQPAVHPAPIPGFNDKFWDKYRNMLRVYGTNEAVFKIGS